MLYIFVIHIGHAWHIVEGKLNDLESTFAIDETSLVFLDPDKTCQMISLLDYDLMFAVPFPIWASEDEYLFLIVD